MGFDQMMTFYNHFAVEKAKIVCTFKNQGTGTMRCCIRLDANSTAITNPDQLLEYGGLTTDTLEAKGVYGANKSLAMTCDIPTIQGIPRRNITTDPNLRGDAATSPVEITYFHVQVWDPLSVGGTVGVDVIMEQTAHFMEPRDLTESLKNLKMWSPVMVTKLASETKHN